MKIMRENWEGDPDFLKRQRYWLKPPSLAERIWDRIATFIENFFKALLKILLDLVRGIPWAPVLLSIGAAALFDPTMVPYRLLDRSFLFFLYGLAAYLAWTYAIDYKKNEDPPKKGRIAMGRILRITGELWLGIFVLSFLLVLSNACFRMGWRPVQEALKKIGGSELIVVALWLCIGLALIAIGHRLSPAEKSPSPLSYRILKSFAHIWSIGVFALIVLSLVGVGLSAGGILKGLWAIVKLFSPFNVGNYLLTAILLSPAIVAFTIADRIRRKAAHQ